MPQNSVQFAQKTQPVQGVGGNLSEVFGGAFEADKRTISSTRKPISIADTRDQFINALSAGVGIKSHAAIKLVSGKIIRFATASDKGTQQSGWFFGDFECAYPSAIFGDWRDSDGRQTWRADTGHQPNPAELAQAKKEMQRIRDAHQAQIKANREAAATEAAAIWGRTTDVESHPYLKRKGINANGARLDGDALVLPIRDINGRLMSVERIFPDGSKRFLKDGEKGAGMFLIGDDDQASPLVLSEGFSTAASIHEATGLPVVVTFDAGNLIKVAEKVRAKYPNRQIVIAADDDVGGTTNTGVEAARKAAAAYGCSVAMPMVGGEINSRSTDFNDLSIEYGQQAVQEAIMQAVKDLKEPQKARESRQSFANSVLCAIALRLEMNPDELADHVSFNPAAVDRLITASAWNPSNSKFYVMSDGLKIATVADYGGLTREFFEPICDMDALEAIATDNAPVDSEAKREKFVSGVMSAGGRKIMSVIKCYRQATSLSIAVDPFANEDVITIKDSVATLQFKHVPLTGGVVDPAVIDDFRRHFPEFESFIELLVAARFAADRKQAHMWLQAPSNWGKSFLLGCLADHGLVVETSIAELDKMLSGSPVGKTISDFMRSWVFAVDEFKGVSREVKQLSDSIHFSPKGMPTVKAPLYLKLFLSAEDVPSLANPETGIEDQFANRFTHVVVNGVLADRPAFQRSKHAYRQSVTNFIANAVNDRVSKYVAMGKHDAADAGDAVVTAFYEKHRIDNGFQRMSAGMPDLINSFVDWAKGAVEKAEMRSAFDTSRWTVSKEEREAVAYIYVCTKTGLMFAKSSGKLFELWVEHEFDKSKRGAVAYKRDAMFKALGGVQRHRVNKTLARFLLLVRVDENCVPECVVEAETE